MPRLVEFSSKGVGAIAGPLVTGTLPELQGHADAGSTDVQDSSMIEHRWDAVF